MTKDEVIKRLEILKAAKYEKDSKYTEALTEAIRLLKEETYSACDLLDVWNHKKMPHQIEPNFAKQFPVSACCNASVKIGGDDKEGTHYHICEACGEACNIAEWTAGWNKPIQLQEKKIEELKIKGKLFKEDNEIVKKINEIITELNKRGKG